MNALRQLLLASAVLVTGTAAALAPGTAQAQRAEVIHWWTSGGESAAVRVFAEQFKAAGGEWVDTAIAGGESARNAGVNRIVGGNPPTVMQFNTGKQFDELVTAGLLRDVDAIAVEGKWSAALPPPILRAVTRDGKVFAVPVNIHGENWLWYNTKVFKDAGVEPPKTWAELVALRPKLEAAGVIPLAQGGQPWQERLLFNAVMLGVGGPELYNAVLDKHDLDAIRGPEFRKVVETYVELRGMADPGNPGRKWNDATNMVITGKAAMQVMGDWAKGEFQSAGLTPGEEYGCVVLGPGTGFIMGGDVFVFPKTDDAQAQAAQDKMAAVMMATDTQLAFNKIKGSVPVRLDVETSSLDACAREGVALLRDPAQQIESTNVLSSADLQGAIDDAITQFWHAPEASVDDFIESYVSAFETAG